MEIKDITVSAERLEEVRGGQRIDVDQTAVQFGGNSAFSSAAGWGVGNDTSSGVSQIASQTLKQDASVHATELESREFAITNSIVGFGLPLGLIR